MNNVIRLTDKVGVIGLDGSAYDGEYQTTIDADLLKQGIELLETLGWEKVDITTVESEERGILDFLR
jgi:hypothetical protein